VIPFVCLSRCRLLPIAAVAVFAAGMPAAAQLTIYVSPAGNDAWSGRLPDANADRTDGPLATLQAARDAARRLRAGGEAVERVELRGGTYYLQAPLVLEPADSHVTFAAYAGERPVISGGRAIEGWRRGANGAWVADVPQGLYFRQLFVNGERRTRARSPNEGYFTIASKAPPRVDPVTGQETAQDRTAFIYQPGTLQAWEDPSEVEVIVYHSWETSRLRIAEVDEADGIVRFTGPAWWPFLDWGPGQRYVVENAPDALDAPGEWYLDRGTGTVSYFPLPGEDTQQAEVVAAALPSLVEFRGDAELGLYVEDVTLDGLAFYHQDWTLAPEGHSDPQAAVSVPAAIMADGALNCAIRNCEVAHVGGYGIWLRRGCRENEIVHNRLHDLGAGGVRIGEAAMAATDAGESAGNLVDNNHLYDGGHVYPSGVGVWVAQSSHNVISHNEIHDLRYSGMSIGWNWGDEPNRCHDNTIEYNHVHHVMSGVLNDGGAIYTLGSSPGSVIRNNVFHDVWPYSAIGWGIYLDATCSQYLVENNIVYHTRSGSLMYHNGGHEHVIRNNVFALSAEQALWPYWESRPNTFERNIIYWTQGTLFIPFADDSLHARLQAAEPLGIRDHNLYWNPNDPQPRFLGLPFADWQALGLDENSLVADPQFVDAAAGDFHVAATSPALQLGFEQIDVRDVGLYGDAAWVDEARRMQHPPTVLPGPPPPPPPTPVDDGFENTIVGAEPAGATVSGEGQGASIRVTAEQAAEGRHSLKFTDAAAVQPAWQPHFFYQPHFTTGRVRLSFDVRLEPEAEFILEWRDNTAYPGCIGPSVTFAGGGQVVVGGQVVAAIPVDDWVRVQIECTLGPDSPGTFDLTITPRGQDPLHFAAVPFRGEDFRELHWLGFIGSGTKDASFHLDNIKLEPLPPA